MSVKLKYSWEPHHPRALPPLPATSALQLPLPLPLHPHPGWWRRGHRFILVFPTGHRSPTDNPFIKLVSFFLKRIMYFSTFLAGPTVIVVSSSTMQLQQPQLSSLWSYVAVTREITEAIASTATALQHGPAKFVLNSEHSKGSVVAILVADNNLFQLLTRQDRVERSHQFRRAICS